MVEFWLVAYKKLSKFLALEHSPGAFTHSCQVLDRFRILRL